MNFLPDQRYSSDGEFELGVGILTEMSKGKVKIYFPRADVMRQYAIESAPLRRVVFKPGDTIIDTDGQSLIIEKVRLEGGLFMYYGKGRKLSEAALGDVSVVHSVTDRLFAGVTDTPAMFALRRETLQHHYNKRTSPVIGFVGGRMDLIPHQLYIAHEVSGRYAPRVLLSDQVGLGKTIEACLILHRLLLSERISRVLILVPESLIHQWFVEMLRRFNLWFHIFDESRCAALEESAPEGNPFLDDQLIICSIEFLAGSNLRAAQAITAKWDMLVVDEAHHLEWSLEKVSKEYVIVEQLSLATKGLLLLTATPEQLGLESHFARLRLLDPSRYKNYQDFINEPSDHKDIANLVDKLSTGKSLETKQTKLLATIFPKERMAALASGDEIARQNLIEDLLDQHGPGRALFRNTRSSMSGFPKRIAHLSPIKEMENQDLWMQRFTDEFNAEIEVASGAVSKQQYWFDEDPRVKWLFKKLKELSPAKILLICKSKEKVLALEKTLAKRVNLKVGVFHEDLTLIQRDKNAAWFADSDAAQILLCSEIGSEGRNFQFAHHLVLFDLPLHPELLEQRIGRLDRIGQTEDIHIHFPYLVGSPQHALARWYHEGLNAFVENLEGGNTLFKLFGERLMAICKTKDLIDNVALENLLIETVDYQKELKQKLADGRDKLLEMNSFRPEVAKKLIEQIQKEDTDKGLENYFTKVFSHFDIEMEDMAARTYLLHPANINTEVFPYIPREGICVTFDRKRALSREDIAFLSWDHPMATAAIDMVLGSTTGSVSCAILKGTGSRGMLLELLFVLETAGKQGLYVDRFLPNTPLRFVVDYSGDEVTDEYSADFLDKRLTPGKMDDLLDNETFVEDMLPDMISAATTLAEELGAKEIEEGLLRMNLTLHHEIDRLKTLQKMNKHIRLDEIETIIEEQKLLTNTINNARLRLDAVQLIRMV